MAGRASVDVVIPTFDARDLVTACIRQLQDRSIASITVVDDVSSDGTADAVAGLPGIRYVRLNRHRGLAFALNRGAACGDAEHVLFLNNDIFAGEGAVDRLVDALAHVPDAGSAAGRLVDPNTGETQKTYLPRAIPGAAALAARLFGLERSWPRNPLTGQHLRNPLPEDRASLTDRQAAGACLLVRRRDHAAIGGWDERFWFWYEDVDYARRLLKHRGPTVYEPRSVFRHIGRASTSKWDKPSQHERLYHGTLQYGILHLGQTGRALIGAAAIVVSVPRILALRWRDPRAAAIYQRVARNGVAVMRGRAITPQFPE